MDYIAGIEKSIGREAKKEFLPMQPGDVYRTYADSSALDEATGFKPDTPLQTGKTAPWHGSKNITILISYDYELMEDR